MKMSDINKVFTDKVSEYIANGYVINVPSMSGSQGEVGKVDLVKGNELIRIWMKDVSGSWKENYADAHRKVAIGRWTYPAQESSYRTVWYGDLETIEETKFYQISRDQWYVEDIEEALRIKKLRAERSRIERIPSYPGHEVFESDRAREIAVNYLKRKVGYKRVNPDLVKIHKVRRYYTTYTVAYHGHNYTLT